MPEPHLRASDADRAAVADVLGAHMSAGRLSVAEYDERLARAYAARTFGELAELTTDLPATPPARPSGATGVSPDPGTTQGRGTTRAPAWQQVARHGVPACGPWAGGTRAAWASWASTAAIVLTIWVATMLGTGEWLYPWPIWVIGPWGAMLLAQSVTGRRDHDERPQLSGQHPAR
ncbi:DUF1707 SHOCT-like domain-containing protein [Modestobacter sp. URMC 112]